MKRHVVTLLLTILCVGSICAQPVPYLTEVLSFPPQLVGTDRERELRIRGLSPGGQYVVVSNPKTPFTVTSDPKDLTIRNDEVRITVLFSPTIPGDYSDEIVLERQPQVGRQNENQIRIRLFATGFLIERTEDLNFGVINVMDSSRRTVLFRSGPGDEFVWQYTREPRAPFSSVTIKGPLRPGRDTLAFVFTFRPETPGRFADTVGIVRVSRGGQALDTAWMILSGVGRPRPFSMRAELPGAPYNVRIGDTLAVDVQLAASGPIDVPENIKQLTFDVSYNPTLLIPIRTEKQTLTVRNGRQVLSTVLDGFAGGSLAVDRTTTIATVRFVVALGDAEFTPLTLESAAYTTTGDVRKTLDDVSTRVNVTNVWRYQDGRSRLVNPLQGVLVLDVDPNPVATVSTMRVRNLPTNGGHLIIADATGLVVADLTQDLRSGARDFTIASSGAADVVVPRGTYLARLAVESELGGTLLSVVRVFVVQ
ncbi:MAG: hypothetical protein RL594_212 [Bacteroidota bacterium]|jgi:hypothetical protein